MTSTGLCSKCQRPLPEKTGRTLCSACLVEAALADRHTLDQWLQLGKPSMYSAARKKVEEILAGPVLDPLSDETIGTLDEILIRADRELA